MIVRERIILGLFLMLLASVNVFAQSGPVSLKPMLKPGQEARYVINASVDTNVTPTGENGIASIVHRETTATVLLRAVVDEKDGVSNEALIEAIKTRTTVDGVERPAIGSSLVGLKIQYRLDAMGRLIKGNFPPAARDAGLAELIFSLTRWVPAAEVAVGATWGQGSAGESMVGDFGYISASAISDIVSGATISYRFSRIKKDTAIVDGTIGLNQTGASLLTTRQGPLNVNVIAAGKGTARVEYDLAASRIIAATTETSLAGRLANIPPSEGKKLQSREGSVLESAKFSIKLVQ